MMGDRWHQAHPIEDDGPPFTAREVLRRIPLAIFVVLMAIAGLGYVFSVMPAPR